MRTTRTVWPSVHIRARYLCFAALVGMGHCRINDFTHTCNMSGPWSDAALDTLGKFPLVTIERFMGQYSHCPWNQQTARPSTCTVEEAPIGLTDAATGLYVEDHAVAALQQLKRRNPKITTIFYGGPGVCQMFQRKLPTPVSSSTRPSAERRRCTIGGMLFYL